MKSLISQNNNITDIYNSFNDLNTLLFYHGAVTHEIVQAMSATLMKKMKADNVDARLLISLFGAFIELAQNIARHSDEKQVTNNEDLSYGGMTFL